jgi:ribosomal protein S16
VAVVRERVGFTIPWRVAKKHAYGDQARIGYWVGCGAIASDRVAHLVKSTKMDETINKPAPKKSELKAAQLKHHNAAKVSKLEAAAVVEAKKHLHLNNAHAIYRHRPFKRALRHSWMAAFIINAAHLAIFQL